MERRCQNCDYAKREPLNVHVVRCMRYPPASLMIPGTLHSCAEFGNVRPHMELDDWCGEFKPVSAPAAGGE